jgi:hypothetical protein
MGIMATIDKLDIGIYVQYARRTQLIEQINQQFHLGEAASIPPQIQMVDFYPKLTELDILLGIVPMHTPWAHFFPPKRFSLQRRSPFSFSRVIPSLGSQEKQEENENKVASLACTGSDEEKEKKTIIACFKQISTLNEWLGFIVGRVGQFLQG